MEQFHEKRELSKSSDNTNPILPINDFLRSFVFENVMSPFLIVYGHTKFFIAAYLFQNPQEYVQRSRSIFLENIVVKNWI